MSPRPKTPDEVLMLLGEISVEFDRWRVKGREERELRNGEQPERDPETGLWDPEDECQNPVEAAPRDLEKGYAQQRFSPCWKARWRRGMEQEKIGVTEGWCGPCLERQRHHEAMTDANIKRGHALRRLTHWRKVYDEMVCVPEPVEASK